jgi:hypothetical protein
MSVVAMSMLVHLVFRDYVATLPYLNEWQYFAQAVKQLHGIGEIVGFIPTACVVLFNSDVIHDVSFRV